jgi:hypothetical protein
MVSTVRTITAAVVARVAERLGPTSLSARLDRLIHNLELNCGSVLIYDLGFRIN